MKGKFGDLGDEDARLGLPRGEPWGGLGCDAACPGLQLETPGPPMHGAE